MGDACFPLFVYGTLMRGERAYSLHARAVERVHGGSLINADLFDLGAYPMVVSGAGRVRGEAHWLARNECQAVLARLDRYEGPEYTRNLLPVLLDDTDATIDAWVYVGLRRPAEPTLIPDGDWRRWCERHV